jgi:uncharacterized protein (UPF0332 family)
MDRTPQSLAKYRIEKANTELEIAKNLFANDYLAKSLNSSYYSMFHATRALLAFEKVDSKRHSGIINFFNNLFIRTGKIDSEYFTYLSTAFNIRQQSDYKDFYIASKEDAEKQINNAEKFISMIKQYLKNFNN